MSAPHFEKYDRKGAYHWDDYYGGLIRANAYTRARYDLVCALLGESGVASGTRVLDLGCGDGALAAVKAYGVLPVADPITVDGGPNKGARIVFVRDPDGVMLELIQAPGSAPS